MHLKTLKGARAKAVNERKKHAGKYSLLCLDEGMKNMAIKEKCSLML